MSYLLDKYLLSRKFTMLLVVSHHDTSQIFFLTHHHTALFFSYYWSYLPSCHFPSFLSPHHPLCVFSPPPSRLPHLFIWPILFTFSTLSLFTSIPFLAVHRRSPIWEVSKWARRAVASSRLCSLAQPQSPAPGWQHILPLPAHVSKIQSSF